MTHLKTLDNKKGSLFTEAFLIIQGIYLITRSTTN